MSTQQRTAIIDTIADALSAGESCAIPPIRIVLSPSEAEELFGMDVVQLAKQLGESMSSCGRGVRRVALCKKQGSGRRRAFVVRDPIGFQPEGFVIDGEGVHFFNNPNGLDI